MQWITANLPIALLSVGLLVTCAFSDAHAQAYLPVIGGPGGGPFNGACKASEMLTGFQLRMINGSSGSVPGFSLSLGGYLDAVRPVCATATEPDRIGSPLLVGTWGRVAAADEGAWHAAGFVGGAETSSNNVQLANRLCPGDQPIVTGIDVNYGNKSGALVVYDVHLFCGLALATQASSGAGVAVIANQAVSMQDTAVADKQAAEIEALYGRSRVQRCPSGQVALGAYGRAGALVDAIGLICGVPHVSPSTKSPLVITARDSITSTGSASLTSASPALAPAIDIAQLDALAARGEIIANQDPLAVELRTQQADGPNRRGFDIGMAAAEGQTLPGPGKDRIRGSLGPDEKTGFNTAVAFSLERNRNADFAATGAAIAAADPVVADARAIEADVFYWLGFDIATGIFGDPTLGARGNTATGAGSLKIRDALSAAGQRGFNASVTLHLSRNYKP